MAQSIEVCSICSAARLSGLERITGKVCEETFMDIEKFLLLQCFGIEIDARLTVAATTWELVGELVLGARLTGAAKKWELAHGTSSVVSLVDGAS